MISNWSEFQFQLLVFCNINYCQWEHRPLMRCKHVLNDICIRHLCICHFFILTHPHYSWGTYLEFKSNSDFFFILFLITVEEKAKCEPINRNKPMTKSVTISPFSQWYSCYCNSHIKYFTQCVYGYVYVCVHECKTD